MELPLVIATNGPPGIGKTWLGEQLIRTLHNELPSVSVVRFGLRDIIWRTVAIEMRWPLDDYELFKESIFADGRTGRQILIDRAEEERAKDTHFWDRQYTESDVYRSAAVIINDSLRKPEEHDWLTRNSSHLITIVIAPTRYSIGQQYDGDSGICLHPRGGFRIPSSSAALYTFHHRMKNDPAFLTQRL